MRGKAVKVPGLEPEIRVRPPKRQISTPSRHSLKCAICNHPDRAAIEFDFLNWRNPGDLVKSYHFRGLSTIYRHAHATGLFAKRRLNLRFAMERIVERVNEVPVTATAVIRAARAIARINDVGQWVDPPSRVIVTHIHAEDSSFVGAPGGTGSQPVDSSVEVSSGHRQARAGTEGFVGRAKRGLPGRRLVEPGGSVASGLSRDKKGCLGGRGFSPDRKARSPHSSLRARQAGHGPSATPRSLPRRLRSGRDASAALATRHSSLATVFDEVLLDEPSDSASAELPRIEGKPAPPEVILELTPEFARCREERQRAIEADRQANAAKNAAFIDKAPIPDNGIPESESFVGRSGTCPDRSVGNRDINADSSSSSLLPQAAVLKSASSALPHRAELENKVANNQENVASPSSLLPQAVVSAPATACPEQGRGAQQPPRAAGPLLGSSGSADPPFPFTPKPSPRWNPRRRF